jgi:hypothetical protein
MFYKRELIKRNLKIEENEANAFTTESNVILIVVIGVLLILLLLLFLVLLLIVLRNQWQLIH